MKWRNKCMIVQSLTHKSMWHLQSKGQPPCCSAFVCPSCFFMLCQICCSRIPSAEWGWRAVAGESGLKGDHQVFLCFKHLLWAGFHLWACLECHRFYFPSSSDLLSTAELNQTPVHFVRLLHDCSLLFLVEKSTFLKDFICYQNWHSFGDLKNNLWLK